jgi:hypothetical protein
MKLVGTVMIKILTKSKIHDFRFKNGIEIFSRESIDNGLWNKNGSNITSNSLNVDEKIKLNIDIKFLSCVKSLSLKYNYLKVNIIFFEKTLIINNKNTSTVSSCRNYIEIRDNGLIFTNFINSLEDLISWHESIQSYLELPEFEGDMSPSILNLSPNAFGYFLHESLGHRLESDDFSDEINWNQFKPVNFDVYDTPGSKSDWGYTPYGDDGTEGSEVKLFCGRTGKNHLLTEATGNLRLLDYHYHPIIRQRCLMVDCQNEVVMPKSENILYLDNIEKGLFEGEKIILYTNIQTFLFQNKLYRLPKFIITLSIEDILNFKAYGKKIKVEPTSGCAKGFQKQLPISFYSTSSWTYLDELDISIQLV